MTETEDERHARLNAEIFRRKAMTPEQRKNEDLDELYGWNAISGNRFTTRRVFVQGRRPCRNKNCGHQIRTPCKLLQYLEECTKCGERYGENHN